MKHGQLFQSYLSKYRVVDKTAKYFVRKGCCNKKEDCFLDAAFIDANC
jgi:hypothetical protein